MIEDAREYVQRVGWDDIILDDIYEPRFRYRDRDGIYPAIADYDDIYNRLGNSPILVGDIDVSTKEGKERFNDLVFTRYDGDVFSNVPSCACRHWKGGDKVGDTCPKCHQLCLPVTEQPIEPLVWIEAPRRVGQFFNLQMYAILRPEFVKSGFSALDWLLDPYYTSPREDTHHQRLIEQSGIKRGLKNFIQNFDSIIHALCNMRQRVVVVSAEENGGKNKTVTVEFIARSKANRVLRFIEAHRHLMFCRYLPFPSRIGFILERSGNRMYADPDMALAVDALISMAKIGHEEDMSLAQIESRVSRALFKLRMYHEKMDDDKIYDKKGVWRKLVFGVDPNFTWRTVITPQFKPHDYDVIYMPWGVSVLHYKLDIAGKLLKEGYTPNEIESMVYDNVQRKHHVIDRIFDQLIAESPGGRGIPQLVTRFPSLEHGSSQCLYALIKRDPRNVSTSISPLIVRQYNADQHGPCVARVA